MANLDNLDIINLFVKESDMEEAIEKLRKIRLNRRAINLKERKKIKTKIKSKKTNKEEIKKMSRETAIELLKQLAGE